MIGTFDGVLFSKSKYQLKSEDRQFLDYIPPASILLGGIVFISGVIIAMVLYETPEGGYSFLSQFFSELGIRSDYISTSANGSEQRYAPPHPDIFNITLYASGFLMIPFFMFSFRQMRNDNRVSNFFLIIAILSGVASGPFLIGVGIFDLSYPANQFWQEHAFWVGILYILLTIVSITWALMLIISSNLPYHTTKWIILDYFFLFVLVLLTILNLADGLGIIFAEDLPLINLYPIETYQKLIAFIFFIYFGLVVGTRLTKTKYDNTPVKHENETVKRGSDTLFCTNCGTTNPKESPFCTNCGVKL